MSNKKILTVFYLGDDEEFLQGGIAYYARKSSAFEHYNYVAVAPTPDLAFLDLLSGVNCYLVLIDFTHKGVDQNILLKQMALLKRHNKYRQVVFAGLFKDKEHLENYFHFSHYGLTYYHIKGSDISHLFDDTFYVAFDESPRFPSYAQAKNMLLPYEISMPGAVTEMDSETMKLICDVDLDLEKLRIKHRLFDTERIDEVPVSARFQGTETGDSMNTYLLNFPYPGPWDEVTPDSLLKDTVETFLSQYEGFHAPKSKFLVYTLDDTLFKDILKIGGSKDFKLEVDQGQIECRVPALRPDIIIIDYLPGPDGAPFVDFVQNIIDAITQIEDYQPYIIIFRSELSSPELQAQFNWPKMLGQEQACQIQTLELLLGLYSGKKSAQQINTEKRCFFHADPKSLVEVKFDVYVTGLSEHEITFYCAHELPMYGQLKLDVPVNCQLLIVPPIRNLSSSSKGTHYMAFIHGIDHDEAAQLRIFVNQIIFTPLKKFERTTLKQAEEIQEKVVPMSDNEEVLVEEKVAKNDAAPRRRSFKKSKL